MTTEPAGHGLPAEEGVDQRLKKRMQELPIPSPPDGLASSVIARLHRQQRNMRLAAVVTVAIVTIAGWFVLQFRADADGLLLTEQSRAAARPGSRASSGFEADQLFAARFPLPPPVVDFPIVDDESRALLDFLSSLESPQENH